MNHDELKDRSELLDLFVEVKRLTSNAKPMRTILGESYVAALEKAVDDASDELFDDLKKKPDVVLPHKFANVYCSQCGSDFGPGEHGYSACASHSDMVPT